MKSKLDRKEFDDLFKAILSLKDLNDCYDFFDDLCTVPELKAFAQRFQVAKLLREKRVYSEIVNMTGASTATISRVNRSLLYGCGGYDIVFGDENKGTKKKD